jgi:hypothetical protein
MITYVYIQNQVLDEISLLKTMVIVILFLVGDGL